MAQTPPFSKALRSETRHAKRPLIRMGLIGPISRQAHFLKVCGARFKKAEALTVVKTSGSSALVNE